MSASASSQPSLTSLIKEYYADKPNFSQFIERTPADEPPVERLDELHLHENHPPKKDNMPVHPAEENATGSITDQVAKESSDSTASTHQHHDVDTGVTSGGSTHANAHKANPGPVVAENIGEPASKDDLKKRAEELNK